MSTLVEITGDDIAALGDADLRDLIGLLCEADYRFAGLPTKEIKWGRHQDARAVKKLIRVSISTSYHLWPVYGEL